MMKFAGMLAALAQSDVQSPPSWWSSPAFAALLCGMVLATTLLIVIIAMFRHRQRDPVENDDHGLKHDISQLMHELGEMTRQMNQQLDARMARLERLIREADEKIDQLNAIAETPAPPSPAPIPQVSVEIPLSSKDERHAEVYALADDGRSLTEIAQRLNRPRGEVELILALRPKSITPAPEPQAGPA